jgi:hypothetical protein
MKNNINTATAVSAKPSVTVGIDVGDRYSHYCMLNGEGEVVEEVRIRTLKSAFRRQFECEERMRIAAGGDAAQAPPRPPYPRRPPRAP